MGQLRTHDLPELVAINTTSGVQGGRPWTMHDTVQPGEPVQHKDFPNSYGICLSRRWGPNDKPMQCEVLWSREPDLIKIDIQPIQAKSRVLRAKWTVAEAPDKFIYGAGSSDFIKKMHEVAEFEGEETYDPLAASTTDLLKMMNEPDVKEITFNVDGSAVVHRRAHSERELPDYLREPDGSIRSLTYHRR